MIHNGICSRCGLAHGDDSDACSMAPPRVDPPVSAFCIACNLVEDEPGGTPKRCTMCLRVVLR